MKQFAPSLFLLGSFFLSFLQPSAHAGTTDYALMSATPYNFALARERLEKFLYKANAKKRAILAQTPVVAVQAAVLSASETGPLLHRIARGEFGIGNTGYPADQAGRQVFFLLLFDSRSQKHDRNTASLTRSATRSFGDQQPDPGRTRSHDRLL